MRTWLKTWMPLRLELWLWLLLVGATVCDGNRCLDLGLHIRTAHPTPSLPGAIYHATKKTTYEMS
jgi:hypothetical protein